LLLCSPGETESGHPVAHSRWFNKREKEKKKCLTPRKLVYLLFSAVEKSFAKRTKEQKRVTGDYCP
jgi:hypothetical protein